MELFTKNNYLTCPLNKCYNYLIIYIYNQLTTQSRANTYSQIHIIFNHIHLLYLPLKCPIMA